MHGGVTQTGAAPRVPAAPTRIAMAFCMLSRSVSSTIPCAERVAGNERAGCDACLTPWVRRAPLQGHVRERYQGQSLALPCVQ